MRELPPDEQKALLPRRDDRMFLVLFYRSSDPESLAVRDACELSGGGGFEAVAVDLDRSAQVAGWFKIQTVPVLAAIADGAILALEFNLEGEGICNELIERALQRRRILFGEAS